jgi:hypothetical protein
MIRFHRAIIAIPSLWLSIAASADAQVFRCTVQGKQVYQQAPCEDTGGKGQRMNLPASSGSPAPKPATGDSAAASYPASPPVSMPAEQSGGGKNVDPERKAPLDEQADACLEWYRPRLRDPRGAYFRDASAEKGVVTITIHATNGYGGYTTKTAVCEFKNGKIDVDWTNIHARRNGWAR